MSLVASLPTPRQQVAPLPPQAPVQPASSNAVVFREPPPYPRRQGFIPRRPEDFGGGGAYPEVHVAQYPLDMGRPDKVSNKTGTLAVTINTEGDLNYDQVVRRGQNKDKVIHSQHKALVPKVDQLEAKNMTKPDEEEVEKTAKETWEALQKVVENKILVAQPKTLAPGTAPSAAQYIKYTPSQQGPQFNSGAGQRIIKLQDMPVDPLEPPKFRHKKVPRGGGSPPVPVMHSPPRPVTAKDMQDWKIPPCISNWKNAKGYTIPLDKRLAADGRGLQETTISDKFASLAESLYVAEQKARETVEMRQKIAKELSLQEKQRKEAMLREMAIKARMERTQAGAGGSGLPGPPPGGPGMGMGGGGGDMDMGEPETAEERAERLERDEIRETRRRERERERRLEAKESGLGPSKKSKITRDRDRDVSEKMALGMANLGGTGEVQYDQRLFNQEQGLAQGFAAEDTYNLYDKPLFADRGGLYKPSRAGAPDDEEAAMEAIKTDRFRPDKGFKGADNPGGGGRSGPVEFEQPEADPFGLDQFLSGISNKDKKKGALDGVGKHGGLRASAGGGGYDQQAGGSGRHMQFERGGA